MTFGSSRGAAYANKRTIFKDRLKKEGYFSLPKKDLLPQASFLQRENSLHVVTDFPSARPSFSSGSNWGRKVCRAYTLMFGGGGTFSTNVRRRHSDWERHIRFGKCLLIRWMFSTGKHVWAVKIHPRWSWKECLRCWPEMGVSYTWPSSSLRCCIFFIHSFICSSYKFLSGPSVPGTVVGAVCSVMSKASYGNLYSSEQDRFLLGIFCVKYSYHQTWQKKGENGL